MSIEEFNQTVKEVSQRTGLPVEHLGEGWVRIGEFDFELHKSGVFRWIRYISKSNPEEIANCILIWRREGRRIHNGEPEYCY